MPSTVATARAAIDRSLRRLAEIQTSRGAWEGEVVWSPVVLAQYLITRTIVGKPAPADLHAEYLRHFTAWQTPDGGWGLHAESPAYLFVTTLAYVALRMIGVPSDDARLVRARTLVRALGTPLAIPTWGKVWLAFCNLYEYGGIYPLPPELWLFPRFFPVHPSRLYCHTRLIYLGMSYLYAKRFRRPADPLCYALRDELYGRPYESIDFRTEGRRLSQRDLFKAPSRSLAAGYAVLRCVERWSPAALQKRACAVALSRIEYEQRSTNYAALSPVNGLLNILALYAADARHPDLEPSLDGMEHWKWSDEKEGVRYNGARSQTWDTAFVVQAVAAANADDSFSPALSRAGAFLRENQLRDEIPNGPAFYRDTCAGGWCFSDARHGWPVSDTTAEALCAALALRERGLETLDEPALKDAVRFILSRQNPGGGWGSYERKRAGLALERINPSEMFGNCMVEHSYVECSASALDALARFRRAFPSTELTKAISASMKRGERFLVRAQTSDGSWPGFWGINYTYGTFFAVRGLLACGRQSSDGAIRRACDWLIAHQKSDGGWGEHWTGTVQGRYIEHPQSQVIMTAWALLTLLLAKDPRRAAISRGADLLIARQLHNGSWPKEGVAGVFFNTAMLHYELYRDYFPLWALGLFERE